MIHNFYNQLSIKEKGFVDSVLDDMIESSRNEGVRLDTADTIEYVAEAIAKAVVQSRITSCGGNCECSCDKSFDVV